MLVFRLRLLWLLLANFYTYAVVIHLIIDHLMLPQYLGATRQIASPDSRREEGLCLGQVMFHPYEERIWVKRVLPKRVDAEV